MKATALTDSYTNRRHFIGGSDARIIMGQDEKALIRLWQEKRGEVGPEELPTKLIVQLGLATEDLNRTGTSATPGGPSRRCSPGSSTRSSPSWRPPSTKWWRGPGRSTRPTSCCRGRLLRSSRPNDLLPRLLLGPIAEPDARSASILVDELDSGFFQNSFDVRERFWVARVPSDFEVGDRIAMQAGRISKVSHRPIQRGPSHSHLCACHSHQVVPLSHVSAAHAYHKGAKLSCLRR
jgi:hypothetical protein